MKIDRVIFAWDGNPLFTGMFELQCLVWPKLGVKPTLAYVGTSLPEGLYLDREADGDFDSVIHLQPSLSVPPYIHVGDDPPPGFLNWQAPLALIYAPGMFPGETVMTSGIDQVPLSRRFLDAVADIPDDRFVIGFGGCRHYDGHEQTYGCRYYPSSHMVARGETWAKVLAGTPQCYPEFVEWVWGQNWPYMWPHVAPGWGLDEAAISQLIAKSEVPVEVLPPAFFDSWDASRVGRCAQVADLNRLVKGEYSEAHLNRPLTAEEAMVVKHYAGSLSI